MLLESLYYYYYYYYYYDYYDYYYYYWSNNDHQTPTLNGQEPIPPNQDSMTKKKT